MDYSNCIYVASCVFTQNYPEISMQIQKYLKQRFNMQIIRCCVPDYKIKEFEDSMPDWLRPQWKNLPSYQEFSKENTIVYVCHNCSAIFQETQPEIKLLSLWELILSDAEFPFPDYHHEEMTIQDCWRSYDNRKEQEAVRSLLLKMNIDTVELEENYEKTQFCGISLYQPSPKRNLILAPERFVKNAEGKFVPHSDEEKLKLMHDYCRKIKTERVVAYCHYCVKGLELGGKDAKHIAELLFPLE